MDAADEQFERWARIRERAKARIEELKTMPVEEMDKLASGNALLDRLKVDKRRD